METIRGRKSLELDFNRLKDRLAGYNRITLDLGTGDGRYVRTLAAKHPDWFIIGVDSCRENLREHSQTKLQNMLFVIASAQDLPNELNGLISHITINFPWGSLLESLLSSEDSLASRLLSVTRSRASMDIHLNAEALVTAGWALETGADQIERIVNTKGWKTKSRSWMDAHLLRSFPTTWAKRLAFGRDPRAIQLTVQKE